jgi:hypothetical protein
MSTDSNWYERYMRRQQEGERYAEQLIAYVVPVLEFLGVKRVEIHYDGAGDDGQVQPPVLTPSPTAGLPEGLQSALSTICEEMLPGGWEINAGSQGCLTIDVSSGRHVLDHEWNEDEDEEYDEDLE